VTLYPKSRAIIESLHEGLGAREDVVYLRGYADREALADEVWDLGLCRPITYSVAFLAPE
jgi:hypothetical protein